MENQYNYYLTIFLVLIFPIFYKYFFNSRRNNLPPSPLAFPIIGHLYLLKNKPLSTLTSLSAKYGPVLYLRYGSMPVLIVSSPSAVEECFTKNDIIFANRPRTMAGDWLTFNYTAYIWAPYGQLWKILRRLTVMELLSSNSLQKTSNVRDQEVVNFTRSLFKFCNGRSRNVDLTNWFCTFSFNLMNKIVAGRHLVSEEDAGMGKGIAMIERLKGIFIVDLPVLNMCDFLPLLRWIGYKGMEKKMSLVHNQRNEFLNNLLEEFRQEKVSVGNREKQNTLIGTLLSLQESEPEFYTEDVIKSIMLVIFIAGTDTSSTSLQWAMRLLLAHPEALHKLRAEIDSQVGNEHLLNESDLTKLPYLHSVINETLRLYPPVPLLLPHYSSEDCTVGGYNVPKHTILLVNIWAIQRDPQVWKEPNEFKPERFEAMEGEKEGFNYKLIPFGMGRRSCPGATMGTRAISLALGALIQCFDWQSAGEENLELSYNSRINIQKIKSLEAICTPRSNFVQLLSQL
ncbi:cytochrome P450 81C13-like [Solanum stenotomum]|uniref:cytochrome P450 81C13-like n=1 Tax=Solanum stenotomum TaxID=172797 RepID=UPI0020D19097|nr:cytochrome P450 81C13-like [Solanum stenotomum]